jgi:DNA-binding transcriptional LysR family regulator
MLHLRRLSYFVAVLDAGTLTAASAALRVAQPALSRQIHQLERDLSLRLFERDRGRLVPTPSGVTMGEIARTLLAQAELAERAAANLRSGHVTALVCCSTPVTTRGLLVPFIASLDAGDPTITTREVGHLEVEHALLEGADFVVTPAPPSSELESIDLGRFPVRAVVSPAHPWARDRRESVGLAELVEEPLIVPPTTSISRQEFDRSLRRAGLAIGPHTECEVDETTIALAATGRGVGVTTTVPPATVWAVTIGGVDGPNISLHMAWQRHHYAAATMRNLGQRLAVAARGTA